MSAKIQGTTITLTRGDSLIINVTITKNGAIYTPTAGDKVRFALKQRTTDPTPLIVKQADIGTMQIRLDPEDTKELAFATYVYDIELTTVDGYVDTFIGPAKFIITEEVY